MPELPEVETYVQELAPQLRGKRVVHADVSWPRILEYPEPAAFCERIRGRRFDTFGRRGKYMLLGLDSGETLVIHLRMTGQLRVQPPEVDPDKHTHLVLELDSGERLHYQDQRKFGRVWLIDAPEELLRKLGPEPLGETFTPVYLARALAGRTATIKALLLNQSLLAGVGNIYADEALYRAGIDPRRAGGSLNQAEIERLRSAIQSVLRHGIHLRGSTLGSGPQNYVPAGGRPGNAQEDHQVFRRTGLPCLSCGTPIQRVVLAQRSTHFCPACQR